MVKLSTLLFGAAVLQIFQEQQYRRRNPMAVVVAAQVSIQSSGVDFPRKVYDIAVNENGTELFVCGEETVVRQLQISDNSIQDPEDSLTYDVEQSGIHTVLVNGTHMFTGHRLSGIFMYNIGSPTPIRRWEIDPYDLTALIIHGDSLFSGQQSGLIIQWDISNGKAIRSLMHLYTVTGFAISNGQYLFSSSHDGSVKQWTLLTGTLFRTFSTTNIPLNAVTVAGDALFAAGETSISQNGQYRIYRWHISTGAFFLSYVGHTGPINALVASGDYLFSGSTDFLIKQWQISTGKLLRDLTGNFGAIRSLAVSGKYLYSGSSDKTAKQWLIPELLVGPTQTATSTVINASEPPKENSTLIISLSVVFGLVLIGAIAFFVYQWQELRRLTSKVAEKSPARLVGNHHMATRTSDHSGGELHNASSTSKIIADGVDIQSIQIGRSKESPSKLQNPVVSNGNSSVAASIRVTSKPPVPSFKPLPGKDDQKRSSQSSLNGILAGGTINRLPPPPVPASRGVKPSSSSILSPPQPQQQE